MTLTFKLPDSGELLVKTGQKIDFDTSFMKLKAKEEVRIPLAGLLRIKGGDIFNSLKKFVGDSVHKGDLVAETKSFVMKRQYFSEYDGIIKEINHSEGTLIMQVTADEKSDAKSFVRGEIASLVGGELKVKVHKGVEADVSKTTDTFGGETLFLNPKYSSILTADDVEGKVVVAKELQPYEQIKLETLGAKGFVTMKDLPEGCTIPAAKIDMTGEEWKKLTAEPLSCCTVDASDNTIYFYN